MQHITSLFSTPLFAALGEILVFLLILGAILWYIVAILCADGAKFDIKNFGQIKQRALANMPKLLGGIVVAIFLFQVLKLAGMLKILAAIATVCAQGIEAALDWIIAQLEKISWR
ncbi:MAG: hypothetical protein ACRC6X_06585 [Culicoidibacterales bacterium]